MNDMDWNLWGAFSPYLVAMGIAYLGGQLIKTLISFAKTRQFNWREFFKSGHMPSTHVASMVSLSTVVGFLQGWSSAVFAISAASTLVIAYDATHVRRAVGEQGLVLRKIVDQYNTEANDDGRSSHLAKPYFSFGHLPIEAIAGGFLGLIIGVIVSLIARG